jgi:hypothetical protein
MPGWYAVISLPVRAIASFTYSMKMANYYSVMSLEAR